MNIFYLDTDLTKCAQAHYDKHVNKMLLEGTQLLCSAYYYTGQADIAPYKLTHYNHPCSVWVRESLSNWRWLRGLCLALYDEYKYRYGKDTHKCGEIVLRLPEPNLSDFGLTAFHCAMPDEFKITDDPVTNYRNYYKFGKAHLRKYTNRTEPDWLIN